MYFSCTFRCVTLFSVKCEKILFFLPLKGNKITYKFSIKPKIYKLGLRRLCDDQNDQDLILSQVIK